MKLDEDDAPEGYTAVKAEYLCGGCKLYRKDRCLDMPDVRCCRSERKDRQLVVFKRK
jgi:hypothetical protein